MARRTAIVLIACVIVVVSCGSDDTSGDATSAPTMAVEPSGSAAATEPVTNSLVAVDASTGDEQSVPLPFMVALQGGVTYDLADVLDDSLSFTNQTDGTYAFQDDGAFVLAADSHLAQPLVTVFDASEARVPADPLFDLSTIGPDASVLDREPLTLPAPADAMFGYFASLPGVTTGSVQDATIAGLPAKAMTSSFADPGAPGEFGAGPRWQGAEARPRPVRFLFTPHGWEDYTFWQSTDRATLTRINRVGAHRRGTPARVPRRWGDVVIRRARHHYG